MSLFEMKKLKILWMWKYCPLTILNTLREIKIINIQAKDSKKSNIIHKIIKSIKF